MVNQAVNPNVPGLRSDGWPNDAMVLSNYAPGDLNKYACQLEDMLVLADKQLEFADRTMIELLPYLDDYKRAELTLYALRPHMERYQQLENLLTGDINNLAKWYVQRERMEAQGEVGMLGNATSQPVEMAYYGQDNGVPQYQAQVQRPTFPSMPAPTNGDKWKLLEQVPISQAWMVLDRMAPQDWQQRQLVIN